MIRPFPFLLLLLLVLSACTKPEEKEARLVLVPSSFAELPGWRDDDLADFGAAFRRSCMRIMKQDPSAPFGPDGLGGRYADWQEPCETLLNSRNPDLRSFLTSWFSPWQASADKEKRGLFTGYYEASLRGARTRQGAYQYPLRLRPDDLVMVDLGEFRDELRGQRIAGRVKGGQLKPYEDRVAIEAGRLPDDGNLQFVWVDSPVDAFFLQIQGSGVIRLDDGSVIRVGYAGQNGHPYYAIGRELIKRGALEKDEVSMQTIRQWLEAHPQEAVDVMNTNKSYVFFRTLDTDGPLGGENVVLTPGRSLAVDRSLIAYGIPVWLDVESPAPDMPPLRRLMVAQDTGGAIRGPVRGDVFWGYGEGAEQIAGQMKAQGRYWFLLPKTVTLPAQLAL